MNRRKLNHSNSAIINLFRQVFLIPASSDGKYLLAYICIKKMKEEDERREKEEKVKREREGKEKEKGERPSQ